MATVMPMIGFETPRRIQAPQRSPSAAATAIAARMNCLASLPTPWLCLAASWPCVMLNVIAASSLARNPSMEDSMSRLKNSITLAVSSDDPWITA